jgi:thiol-disulfide isomerase/thioredoxin
MTGSSPPTTLDFYRRDGCTPCDDARLALQEVLEERVRRGETVPRVRVINLSERPELEPTYGARIPVIALGGQELSLAPGYRQIESLLDRVLGRLT